MQRLRFLISVPVVIDVAGETWKQGNEGIKEKKLLVNSNQKILSS